MPTLTVNRIVRAGVLNTANEVAGVTATDYFFDNSQMTFLRVTSTPANTVTIETTKTVDGLAVADRTVAIGAATTRFIGPFGEEYEQPDGTVKFTLADSATVAAFSIYSR